jgi:tRNA-2-methylthio-N6-dimethylallyladenosine synthase
MERPRTNRNHPATRRTAWVETYGCQMNISDGELMQGVLLANGYALASSPEEADVILVNTCAIREHAEQRVIGRVGELNRIKRDRPELIIGVTGCMAQRIGETILGRASHVDLVMGPDGYRSLPEVLARLRPGRLPSPRPVPAPSGDAANTTPSGLTAATRRALPVLGTPTPSGLPAGAESGQAEGQERIASLELTPDENYEGLEVRRASKVTAWVPIQRGCNYRCTYCIVPYVRGSEKNRESSRILDEVRQLAASGITEITLLGQTVNSWRSGEWSFARLLRAVARVDGIRRVRFTSPHPNDLTDDVIEVMATEPAICRQLHLPVQSGHDRTLRRMLRRYTVAGYLEKVSAVRSAVAGIALSTDVIVGFPGETDDEYEATLELMREVRYDDAFLYKYSEREGTPATRLPRDQFVDAEVAQARLERLIETQRTIQASINEREVGSEVEVLVERPARSAGDVMGRTERLKVVAFPGDDGLTGRYVQVRLTSTTGATFRGIRVDGGVGRGGEVRVA